MPAFFYIVDSHNSERFVMKTLFTSESVAEGHPDKVCDAVSDRLVDLFISHDAQARTAIEALATTNRIILAGEISALSLIDPQEIEQTVRDTVADIGYDQPWFSWKNLVVENYLHCQSPDIALGVNNCGAGDQGIMFGYARNETGFNCDYMPLAIQLSHQILRNIRDGRRNGALPGLQPDAKSQVTVAYEDGNPVGIAKIVVSSQHDDNISLEEVRKLIKPCIVAALPEGWLPADYDILINPTGRFVVGGPDGDSGLTGRKIVVDTYGGYAPHGGGAFSGKDPTKVDRSAAYMLRYLAKNIVAAGLAQECLLQVSYAIGVAEPLSLFIDTKGTSVIPEQQILSMVRRLADLTPCGIIERLNLKRPIYAPTAAYGHFGRTPGNDGTFTWEKLDLVKDFKACL